MNVFPPSRACARAIAIVLAALGANSAAGAEDGTGFTDTEVVIGGTCATSGPLASFGTICSMEEAYFKYVNEALGGVKMGDGKTRKIKYVWYNDEYSPPRTVEQVKRLVERDEVAAIVNVLGTATNLAVWDYLNKRGVPQLYIGTGATIFGTDLEKHPYTMAWQVPYSTEAAIYAEFVKSKWPQGKVAILYQKDDFGEDLRGSFKRAIEGSGVKVIAEEAYDPTSPTIDSQVVNLAASKADVLLNFSIPRFAAQAIRKANEIDWKPAQIIVNISASVAAVFKPAGLEASKGIYSGIDVIDPSDPRFANDPGQKLYREIAAKYGTKLVNPDDPTTMWGFINGQMVVKTLQNMKKPTRDAMMQAARNQCGVEIMGLLPGIKLCTQGAKDPFPIESMQMAQFDGTRFEPIGPIITRYEGNAPALAGKR
ncbi:MAG: ABC transporter substrate-binding protein [Burkholderiaceae bacterium]